MGLNAQIQASPFGLLWNLQESAPFYLMILLYIMIIVKGYCFVLAARAELSSLQGRCRNRRRCYFGLKKRRYFEPFLLDNQCYQEAFR